MLAVAAAVAATAVAIYWLLIATEGSFLGPRVVTRLYDRYAGRYDRIKEFDPLYEQRFIGEPAAKFLADQPAGRWALDVAAGTGRFAEALHGAGANVAGMVCLDRSRPMLAQATRKLADTATGCEIVLLEHDAASLPFQSDTFDLAACLEALEFMPDPLAVVDELIRVLRPGGLLILTNRVGWQSYLFPGKRWSRERLSEELRRRGCSWVSIAPWQVDYDRVLALKSGEPRAGQAAWPGLLCCPRGHGSGWLATGDGLECSACGATLAWIDGVWRFGSGSEKE